jgi:hypothetical protein
MTNKTEGVKILVQDVLATIPEPYGEDIILKVFQEIEGNPEWHRRYKSLSNDLADWIINNWIGKYVKDQTGLNSLREVSAKEQCSLITSYMKLGHV